MGLRMAYKELDPRFQATDQNIVNADQYYNRYQAIRDQEKQQQLQQQSQWAQAEGQRRAAEIAGEHPIINALPKALDAGLSTAKTVHGMKTESARLAEEQKTGASTRALQMENMLGAQQSRMLNAQFGSKERQMGLDVSKAGIGATTAQTEGQKTQNEISGIKLAQDKAQQLFETADAQKYGFQGAH